MILGLQQITRGDVDNDKSKGLAIVKKPIKQNRIFL